MLSTHTVHMHSVTPSNLSTNGQKHSFGSTENGKQPLFFTSIHEAIHPETLFQLNCFSPVSPVSTMPSGSLLRLTDHIHHLI